MPFILASTSPRRVEILRFFSLPFIQENPHFDESSIPFLGDPKKYVEEIAKGKAKNIATQHPQSIVIAADTIVFANGNVFGKPKDNEDAKSMLSYLSNTWHEIITGVCIQKDQICYCATETTRVLSNKLSATQIQRYLQMQHLSDKAGSYAIQKSGGLFVRKMEGCFYNACGLPLNTLCELLSKFDIDLWDHLQEFSEAF